MMMDFLQTMKAVALHERSGKFPNVSADAKNPTDLRNQIRGIEDTIERLRGYRDDCKRGTARRADYASSIRRLKELKRKLEQRLERAVEAKSPKREGLVSLFKDALLVEGGLGGHLRHLYDNWDLTFGELKDVIRHAERGELERVTEKADGQNIFVSWDMQDGVLKAARNKGNIKQGGLNAEELANKFAGRGAVHDAFVKAFTVLSKAIGTLSPQERNEIFGPNANNWYSVEVMYTDNPNTINFDNDTLIFHEAGAAAYDKETGKPLEDDISAAHSKLVSAVERMQDAVADEGWKVMGPPIVRLKGIEDEKVANAAISELDSIMSEYGIQDSDSIGLYIKTRLYIDYLEQLPVSHDKKEAIARKVMGEKGAPKITQIVKGLNDDEKEAVKELVDSSKEVMKKIIAPVESVIHDFAVELLKDMNSVFVADKAKEVQRLRSEVQAAIDAIEGSGSEEAMTILFNQLKKLRGIHKITTPAEGVVFYYKDQPYKFTGNFAPMNQLIGLFKYGRGSVPPLKIMTKNNDVSEGLAKFFNIVVEKKAAESDLDTKNVQPMDVAPTKWPPPANQWQSWSQANTVPFKSKKPGVGPGENKLAYEFGGEVQGGNVSYDLVIGSDKVEVKMPDGGQIRPGTKGIGTIATVKSKLDDALRQLQDAMSIYRQVQPYLDLSDDEQDAMERLMAFTVGYFHEDSGTETGGVQRIIGGELAQGTIRRQSAPEGAYRYDLIDALRTAYQMKKRASSNKTVEIEFGGEKYNVPAAKLPSVIDMLGIPEHSLDIEPGDLFASKLTHPAFDKPADFMKEFQQAMDPSLVFAGTDGLMLVDEEKGYYYIPASDYESKLEFVRISQGKPKFKINY